MGEEEEEEEEEVVVVVSQEEEAEKEEEEEEETPTDRKPKGMCSPCQRGSHLKNKKTSYDNSSLKSGAWD